MPGPFHRVETRWQTTSVAEEQVRSGEIWGRTPQNNGMTPTVQAYPNALPTGRRGVVFTTPVDPYPNGSPIEVRWYLKITPGVQVRIKDGEEFASIPASVTNHQP